MQDNTLGRRDFLKLALASAAAAGLSHFRFLNIGGVDVALADQDDDCTDPGGTDPDVCNPGGGNVDSCKPQNSEPDDCETGLHNEDICAQGVDQDMCIVPGDPAADYACPEPSADTCNPPTDPDLCAPPQEPDECIPPDDVDYCEPPDACDPLGIPPSYDLCAPWEGNPDICTQDTDEPTAIDVESFGARARSNTATLPVLGGLAAALGGALVWLRRRIGVDPSNND